MSGRSIESFRFNRAEKLRIIANRWRWERQLEAGLILLEDSGSLWKPLEAPGRICDDLIAV